jgi:hypothetical protein
MAKKIGVQCDNIPKFYRYIPKVTLKFKSETKNELQPIPETLFNILAIEQLGSDLHNEFVVKV